MPYSRGTIIMTIADITTPDADFRERAAMVYETVSDNYWFGWRPRDDDSYIESMSRDKDMEKLFPEIMAIAHPELYRYGISVRKAYRKKTAALRAKFGKLDLSYTQPLAMKAVMGALKTIPNLDEMIDLAPANRLAVEQAVLAHGWARVAAKQLKR